jgi:hypothetical protein
LFETRLWENKGIEAPVSEETYLRNMAATVEVRSHDPVVKARRVAAAQRVLREFGDGLPDLKLLAFLDDENWDDLKRNLGPANRGGYTPIKVDTPTEDWPPRVANLIFVPADDSSPWLTRRVFEHLIYLHGSTCNDETALTMTFAHELQHFVQYGFSRQLLAEGRLIPRLPREVFDAEKINWHDIPHEREARIVAKRVGEKLCGADAVKQYIDRRIIENVTANDVEDWRFSQQLDPSVPYDLSSETKRIFQRLRPYRQALENVLQEMKADSTYGSDYNDIDLSPYFDAA